MHNWNTRGRRENEEVFEVLAAQSCPAFFVTPMDCSLPGSSVHGILQARILAAAAAAKLLQSCPTWVAIPFSRGSSQLRD